MVLNIQRKFSFIQSIPGIYAIQRPFLPIQMDGMMNAVEDNQQKIGFKRQIYEQLDDLPSKSLCLGYTTPQCKGSSRGPPVWSIPPLLPSNIGTIFTNIPFAPVPYYGADVFDHDNIFLGNLKSRNNDDKLKGDECVSTCDEFSAGFDVKVETGGIREEGEPSPLNQAPRLEDGVVGLGFEHHRGGISERCCKS